MKRQQSSTQRVSSFRRGLLHRGAALIVPAALSVLALAGVAMGPALERGDYELALHAAEQRVAAGAQEPARHEALERAHTQTLATEALTRIHGMIPGDCSPVVAHGLIRAVSKIHGLDVEVEIGVDADLGLTGAKDGLFARRVTLTGQGRLESLFALLSTLRALGYPTAVFGVAMTRDRPTDASFSFRVDLGLLHHALQAPSVQEQS